MFDYNEVALFIKVVETGSFTEASRQLGIPKGTISRKVAQLEERLGSRLLQRNTRRLNVTDAGRDLAARCSGLLAQLEEATSGVRVGQNGMAGNIRVAAPASVNRHLLSRWIPEFLGQHEALTFEVLTSDSGIDLLEQGADLLLFIGHLPDSSFIARSLGDPSPVLVASPEYLAKTTMPQNIEQLAEHRCLAFGASSGKAAWIFGSGPGRTRIDIEPRVASVDFDFLVSAALEGLGIAHVPRFLVEGQIATGELRHVLPGQSPSLGEMCVVYPSNRYLPNRVRRFIEFLVEKGTGRTSPGGLEDTPSTDDDSQQNVA